MGTQSVPEQINYDRIDSPLGSILIAGRDGGLAGLWFAGQKYEAQPDQHWLHKPGDKVLRRASDQLTDYFSGKRAHFDIPLDLVGTTFQRNVWAALLTIPCGQTVTYGQLAEQLGKPKAVRAAAAAVGRNPASILVPCHRVLGANGSLTGYAGGLKRKRYLLDLESATVQNAPRKVNAII